MKASMYTLQYGTVEPGKVKMVINRSFLGYVGFPQASKIVEQLLQRYLQNRPI